MKISLEAQTLFFLQSILFGVGLSFFYEILRAIRHTAKAGVFLTALLDSLFWIAVIIGFFLFVIVIVKGEGRAYILIGAVLGAILYFMTVSQVILQLLCAVFGVISRIIKSFKKFRRKICGKIKSKILKNKKCDKIRKKHFHFWRKRFKIK